MPRYIAKVLLQDVTKEEIFHELDQAMADEEGYPYITDENDKIFALPPDEYEFDTEIDAKRLLGIVKLICASLEKKYNLKKTPILIAEVAELEFANLEELSEEDFQPLN